MKKQITRISILQSSKIVVLLYVILGLFYSLIGIPMIIFGESEVKIMGAVYLFMPIVLGIFGFLFFALFGWLYNLLVKVCGGIEFELTDVE